jgi:Na+/H+ antiporter
VSYPVLAVGGLIAVIVVASRSWARITGLPYPVFLVTAGAAAAFIPHVPTIRLQPQVVFLGFLPPLVYHAGAVTSPRELQANALPIGLSALGLVLATTFAVAAAVWGLAGGFTWIPAVVLGAVVAPTDPVAATSVLERLGAPPRVTLVLEGESLVNDGISLTLLALGIAAAAAPVSVGGGVLDFVKVAGGGTALGLVVGWVFSRIGRPVRDPAAEVALSLLVPYVAYLPADILGLSGVLSTLTTGLVLGQRHYGGLDPTGRIRVSEFWQALAFLLESALFVLVGLQLRSVVDGLGRQSTGTVVVVTAVTVGVVIVVRLGWWLAVPTLRWRPEGRIIDTGDVPWQQRVALGWSGLRGAISLAAALSVPLTAGGKPFPQRDLIVFITFCVIIVTLVGQGTSLPWLLRKLALVGSDTERRQHRLAQRRCAEVALRHLDQMVAEEELDDDVADLVRQVYERRLQRAQPPPDETDSQAVPGLSVAAVQRRLLRRQQDTLRQLHRKGDISFAVMRQVRRELDLEQASLER